MIRKAARTAIIFTALLIELTLSSQVLQPESLTLTVFKESPSLVQDKRKIAHDAGISTIYFTDLPISVNQSTITITPNNSNGTIQILEKSSLKNQSSQYGSLKNYIGKTITFDTLTGSPKTRTEKLLAYGDDFIKVQNTFGEIQIFSDISNLRFPALGKDPITTPTIAFVAYAGSPTIASTQASYYVSGLSWSMNYIFTLNSDQTKATLSSTFLIDNESGKNYDNLTLKIVSKRTGAANTDNSTILSIPDLSVNSGQKVGQPSAPRLNSSNFNVQIFQKYIIFTLNYPINLKINQSKQIQSFETVNNITVFKIILLPVITGGESFSDLRIDSVYLMLNDKQNGLGDPFIPGNIQLYKKVNQTLIFFKQTSNKLTILQNDTIKIQQELPIKLKASIKSIESLVMNQSINPKSINSTDLNKTSEIDNNTTNYAASMELTITNDDSKPITVLTTLENKLVKNLNVQYFETYKGLKWSNDSFRVINMTLPPNSKTVIQWIEYGRKTEENNE